MFSHGSNHSTGAEIRPRRLLVLALVAVTAIFGLLPFVSFNAYNGVEGDVVTFSHLPLARPLVSLDFAATVLDIDLEKARNLIEDGSLLWAWDLGRNQQRPLIRVLTQSLADFHGNRIAPKPVPSLASVLNEVFPAHGEAMTAHYLSRRWGVDGEHIANLIRAGKLRLARGSDFKRGRDGSPKVDFQSVADFMSERQML